MPLKLWNNVCGLGLCPRMSLRSLVERGHEKIAWCVEWGWCRLRAPARSGWYGGGELERDRGVLGLRNSLMRRAKPGYLGLGPPHRVGVTRHRVANH